MHKFKWYRRCFMLLVLVAFSSLAIAPITAQQVSRPESPTYTKLKKFELRGKASVSNLTLKRDRATMVFTGDFYFASPINGRVPGAVFIGNGTFEAAPPDSQYDKDILKRFIEEDVVKSDFHSAVFRFSDDTFDVIGKGNDANAAATNEAQKLATELDERLLKETGANLSARMMVSLDNKENPGLFFAQFEKGKRGRFSFVVDPQARLLSSAFGLNGGEKVLVFSYASIGYTNDLWIATYSEEDIKNRRYHYSDEYDLVIPQKYNIEVDVREARRLLKTKMQISFVSLVDNLNAVPMNINQGLSEYDNKRLTEAMRIKSAKMDGGEIAFIQEDFEAGLSFVLPRPMKKGEQFRVELALEGDFISNQRTFENSYYPQFNKSWYPTHGFNTRSQYDLVFRHKKIDRVASIGKLVREEDWPDSKEDRLTEYVIDRPVPVATFAAGRFEHYSEKFPSIGEMPVEVYSVSGAVTNIKEKSVAAFMGDALFFFSKAFGPYPFADFRAAVSPVGGGQSFGTLSFYANSAAEANRSTYAAFGETVARQWWGNGIAPRSYRDQWLNEGFAKYAGIMFVGARQNLQAQRDYIKENRLLMEDVATGDKGVMGKVAELGPMIMGARLNTRIAKASNPSPMGTPAGYRLANIKGALVLRMLHFLFTDLSLKEQKDKPFYDMLADFASTYKDTAASTEDFMEVAGKHFARTELAKRMPRPELRNDLNWFFNQWVYDAKYPNYRLEYGIEEAGGQSNLNLTVFQENAGEKWVMPLPVTIKFADNTKAEIQVLAIGPQSPTLKVPLPKKVSSVELDPDYWILSYRTSTKKK
jgi:hypothetical protein